MIFFGQVNRKYYKQDIQETQYWLTTQLVADKDTTEDQGHLDDRTCISFPVLRLKGKDLPFFYSDYRELSNSFRRIATRAGVKCTLHDLRKTFCTRLSATGANVHMIGTLAGHENPAVTYKHYTGLQDEALKNAVEAARKGAQ